LLYVLQEFQKTYLWKHLKEASRAHQ
jgi:hypothetical protein